MSQVSSNPNPILPVASNSIFTLSLFLNPNPNPSLPLSKPSNWSHMLPNPNTPNANSPNLIALTLTPSPLIPLSL
jgi:hypothetical protein